MMWDLPKVYALPPAVIIWLSVVETEQRAHIVTVLVLLLPILATVAAELAVQRFGSLLVTIAMASFGHVTKHREAVPWALAIVYTLTTLNAHYLDAPVSGSSTEAGTLLHHAAAFAGLKIFETTYTQGSLFSSMLLRGNACHSASMCAFPNETCDWENGGLSELEPKLVSSCGMTRGMYVSLLKKQTAASMFTDFLRVNMQSVAHNIMCVGMVAFLLGRYTGQSRGSSLSGFHRAVQLPVATQQVLTDVSLFGAPCIIVMLSVIYSWYCTHIVAFTMRAVHPNQFVAGKFLTHSQSLTERMQWWIFVRSPWPVMSFMMFLLMWRRYAFARTRNVWFDIFSWVLVAPFMEEDKATSGEVRLLAATLTVLAARNKRIRDVDLYDIAFFLGVVALFWYREFTAKTGRNLSQNVPFG